MKKRIIAQEFFDEQMEPYCKMLPDQLIGVIREMLECHVWTDNDIENHLANDGRELIDEPVKEDTLECTSCHETLNTIVYNESGATVFRIAREGKKLYLKEDHRSGDVKVNSKVCPNCAIEVDLSDFEITYVD